MPPFTVSAGKHNDWKIGFLPDFSAHLKAVLIRQIDVQKNQVSPRRKGGFCDMLKIATTGTLVSVFFKKLGKFLTDCWFIFYDKNFHFVVSLALFSYPTASPQF